MTKQEKVIELLKGKPNDKIYIYYGKPCTGKTTLMHHVCSTNSNAYRVSGDVTSFNTLKHILLNKNKEPEVIFVDGNIDLKILYVIKNGHFITEGTEINYDIPHVIAFSNDNPDLSSIPIVFRQRFVVTCID